MLHLYCVSGVFAVKKILLSEKKFFIYVFLDMVYIFYLLNVVTVVYDGGRCL